MWCVLPLSSVSLSQYVLVLDSFASKMKTNIGGSCHVYGMIQRATICTYMDIIKVSNIQIVMCKTSLEEFVICAYLC